MGLNAIIACHRCEVQSYMLRGEEPLDLQFWMRKHNGDCWALGHVRIYRDCDEPPSFPRLWDYEDRPYTKLQAETKTKPKDKLGTVSEWRRL